MLASFTLAGVACNSNASSDASNETVTPGSSSSISATPSTATVEASPSEAPFSPPADMARLDGTYTADSKIKGFGTSSAEIVFTPACASGPCGGKVSSGGAFQPTAGGYSFMWGNQVDNGIGITCYYLFQIDVGIDRSKDGPSGTVATELSGDLASIKFAFSQPAGQKAYCPGELTLTGTATLTRVG